MKRGNIKKFGRVRSQRKALMKSLATALIEHGRIMTTETKAKALSPFVAGLMRSARTGTVSARRLLRKDIGEKAVKKLVDDIAPKFKESRGGYTRVIKLHRRKTDGAPVSMIEWTA